MPDRSEFNPPARSKARRAQGAAEVAFCGGSGITRLRHLRQTWPCRVLFPSAPRDSRPEAVVVNTAGGMVAGDRLTQIFETRRNAGVTFTTQAAEKIYRSDGAACEVSTQVKTGRGCRVEWMPQETILFEGSRLCRRTRLCLDPDSVLLAAEITVFGRRARGETFESGCLRDDWEVRIGRKLTWSDRLRIGSGLNGELRRPFAFGSAAAVALMVCHAPDPAGIRDRARQLTDGDPQGGFTIVNGLLIGRFVSSDAARLRELIPELWIGLRQPSGLSGGDLPRVWHL